MQVNHRTYIKRYNHKPIVCAHNCRLEDCNSAITFGVAKGLFGYNSLKSELFGRGLKYISVGQQWLSEQKSCAIAKMTA